MYQLLMLLLALLVLGVSSVFADDACKNWTAKITSMQGIVEIRKASSYEWVPATFDDNLCENDALRTAANSRARVQILEETFMVLDERSSMRITNNPKSKNGVLPHLLKLFSGEALFRSRRPGELGIETPFVNAMHEGTEFLVKVSQNSAQVVVFDGVVVASNSLGEIRVVEGQSAVAAKGQAPMIGPRIKLSDAVQWTLYYPPVVDYQASSTNSNYPILKPALDRFQTNDLSGAFEALDQVKPVGRSADYHIIYASLLLTVGQVKDAESHLDKVSNNSPQYAQVLALRSIIALAKNDQQQALRLAQQAQQLAPNGAASNIALSYVYQSLFDIDKALESATEAARVSPKNGLAWARVSEMELATGNVDASMEAARKAQALNPQLAKTNTVLGYARLASLDLSDAEQSFRTAIQRDPSDPLARLGLGLAKIRQGHIKSGTKEMETAANLDPDNALIRSYLGKAYYEQRRGDIASTEYAIAKKLDPNDPTPWFYDAIYKQTVNRPVEALHDMQKAIELNDNRAVFRSKLLLDEDLAARSAAIGRIYNDLGFEQIGLEEGWKSLNSDPSSYSAHRLLADNYSSLPRHKIARVSELFQSQLLQPLNITPVQPQLAESNLLILDGLGPASSSFNEFNPLFARNQLNLQASGVFGNNETYGDEIVQSGLYNNFSYSIGQFHYETDGFRPNSDLDTNLYNVFVQSIVSTRLNLQLEYRRENSEAGDLRQLLDSGFLFNQRRQELDRDSARIGFNFTINPNTKMLGSFIYGKLNRKLKEPGFTSLEQTLTGQGLGELLPIIVEQLPDGFITRDNIRNKATNLNSELQLLGRWNRIKLITGISFANQKVSRKRVLSTSLSSPTNPNLVSNIASNIPDSVLNNFPGTTKASLAQLAYDFVKPIIDGRITGDTPEIDEIKFDENHTIGYIYTYSEIIKNLNLTLGASINAINRSGKVNSDNSFQFKTNYVSPKFGLIWNPFKNTTLRAAWFKSVKSAFVSNQTIEPTNVAGFNQFFDDLDNARSTTYGFAFNQKLTSNITIGGVYSKRKMKTPSTGQFLRNGQLSQDERTHRAYAYWTPFTNLSLSAEYFYELFDREPRINIDTGTPTKMRTQRVPLSINYFHESGLFGKFVGNYIHQNVTLRTNANDIRNDSSNNSKFWIFDSIIGYRLPKRLGIINLGVKNIFNRKFNFQDSNFNVAGKIEGDFLSPIFVPERIVFGQFTFAF